MITKLKSLEEQRKRWEKAEKATNTGHPPVFPSVKWEAGATDAKFPLAQSFNVCGLRLLECMLVWGSMSFPVVRQSGRKEEDVFPTVLFNSKY